MKVLYIITCPREQFQKYYETNNEKADILSKDKDGLENIKYENLYTYSKPRISSFDFSLIKKIRKQKYERIVFFYNNPLRKGYFGVELFTLLFKAKRRVGVYPDQKEQALSWPVFLLKGILDFFIYVADLFGCVFIALSFIPLVILINLCSRLIKKDAKGILFLGMGGKYSASYRVRCNNFANVLKRRGYNANSMSFYDLHDRFLKDDGSTLSRFYDFRRCMLIVNAYFRIMYIYKNINIYYFQKIDFPAIAAYLATLGSGRRFIIDYDDWDKTTFPEFFHRINMFPFLRFNWLTKHLIKKSLFIIAASKYLKDHFQLLSTKKVFYIPTGVDTKDFLNEKKVKEDDLVTISWMGTIYKINAEWLYYFLNILNDVQNQNNGNNISFEITGEGTFEDYVKEYVVNNKIANVIFNDWMSYKEIPKYLSSIDIGVFPMEKDRDYERSKSPTKLFEYMASGIPCVASNIGELTHVIEDGKNGFLANNAQAFKEKLLKLIKNKDLREKMGKEAAKTVRDKYSLEKCGDKLEKAICSIITAKGVRF
ncbi:MAG: glycosyltransferase family 4 protein [Candidatus Aureabacteria bacterium]|nr:glycosyltransferase family 4 protein [Candidatus Auribacterota bacterium]